MSLVPTGGLTSAMIAPVPGAESTAAPGEFKTAVGVSLHCRDTAQTTFFHIGVPEK